MGKGRAPCCDKSKVKRGPWTPEEDFKLITFIQQHGHPNWRALPSQAGLLRCGKSCRLRWINYLRPDVKRGNFTPKEEETVINLHQAYGNKWSKIASFLPGRTDNEIKNVWNTHLKKRLGIKSTKSSSSRRRKTKKSLDAFVVESSSLKSSSSSSNSDQVDRDNNDTISLDNETLECKLSATTLRDGDERKESPSPSLISCVSNVSVKDRSLVHMDANFDSASSLQGMCMDDLGVLDELRFQIPPEFDESGFWNLIDLDNLCSPQTTEIEARTCKSFEESNATGFNQKHTFTSDPITHWVRNLEIELGLDDME